MKGKKILSIFLALLTGTALAVPAAAEVQIGHITTEEGKKNTDIYIKTGVFPKKESDGNEDELDDGDGDVDDILLREPYPYLAKGENCVINFYGQGEGENPGEIIDEISYVSVEVLTEDYDWYWENEFKIDTEKRSCYTVKELAQISGVPDGVKIKAVQVFKLDFYPFWIDVRSCENDWISFDGESYYIKEDGTLATKSMVIDEVRYKFTSDGICHGRYTGWTKDKVGKRYWKNGKPFTSQILEGKNGKKYYLDDSGYVTRVED